MTDLLDASALLGSIPRLLPESSKNLSTPQDALALLLHSAMTALGFRLVAIDESAPAKEPEAGTPGLLPEGWNIKGPDVYTFKYKHEQSSFTFLLKLVKISGKMIVHGIALEVGIIIPILTRQGTHDFIRTTRPRRSRLRLRTLFPPRSSRTMSNRLTDRSYTDTYPPHASQTSSLYSKSLSFSRFSLVCAKKGIRNRTSPDGSFFHTFLTWFSELARLQRPHLHPAPKLHPETPPHHRP